MVVMRQRDEDEWIHDGVVTTVVLRIVLFVYKNRCDGNRKRR